MHNCAALHNMHKSVTVRAYHTKDFTGSDNWEISKNDAYMQRQYIEIYSMHNKEICRFPNELKSDNHLRPKKIYFL